MATHESHQNALRQRDALAREVLDLRRKIAELCQPDAALDLAALVAEIGILRSEIARLKAAPPADGVCICYGMAPGEHSPLCPARASDNPQGFRQPLPPDRCRSTYKAAIEVERVCTLEFGHVGAHGSFP